MSLKLGFSLLVFSGVALCGCFHLCVMFCFDKMFLPLICVPGSFRRGFVNLMGFIPLQYFGTVVCEIFQKVSVRL